MIADAAKVYSIAPGQPFLEALADGLLARAGADPVALSDCTALLPTRRACRALAEAFLRRAAGRPLLLPRLVPLGDLDIDEITLTGGDQGVFEAAAELPPAIPELRRRLLLTRLVLKWGATQPDGPRSPDQAARLAGELARLLDQVQTERLSLDALQGLVPEEHARHWQITLEFLTILTEHWPAVLADEGCLDPADRRNRAMRAQAEAWRRAPPPGPVIAAGTTGSVPATAELVAVVAGLAEGAVVLPGLDRHADDETWDEILDQPTHPQHAIARLLRRLDVARDAVADWPGLEPVPPAAAARRRLISEAMRPAATTEAWPALTEDDIDETALDRLIRLDCPGPREEAEAVALLMRETLEQPELGRTAALVTFDRELARRVAAELRRWGIKVDDSAGVALADTVPGGFLRLVAAMLAEDLAPVPLLACFKHPLAAGGRRPAAFRALTRRLERVVLRGPRPGPGFAGLQAALGDGAADLAGWIDQLAAICGPLAAALGADSVGLEQLLAAHVELAERLAASDDAAGAERLWAGDAGEAMADFVAELRQAAAGFPAIAGPAYPALFAALMAGRVVRPRYGRHPRLFIWGPLEARLQQADRLILGGLNEAAWPPEAATDPWLSRPMRAQFGLPPPERRIGLSAHDFAQGFCAGDVVLTRAERVEGTPTVPSRWLLRLDNVLAAAGHDRPQAGDAQNWLQWRAALDRPRRPAPLAAPEPRPPVAVRPRRLSVTQIETWMRDPYAIYARHILKLKALDRLDADPGAADYGSVIHRTLDRFIDDHPGALPADAEARLIALGVEEFDRFISWPGVWAFWWPRFERVARWFVGHEARRRAGIAASSTELDGSLGIAAPYAPFTLTAKADRIDRTADGRLTIIDYKTGALPKIKEVAAGYAPQLPLEAAIAMAGGFDGVAAAPVAELLYWRLKGGEPAGEEKPAGADPAGLAKQALDGLERLVAAFDDAATPYRPRPRPAAAPRFSDYEHLARVKEWSAGAAEDAE
jgi:ATP-dependent helicase/nuclease subunit B